MDDSQRGDDGIPDTYPYIVFYMGCGAHPRPHDYITLLGRFDGVGGVARHRRHKDNVESVQTMGKWNVGKVKSTSNAVVKVSYEFCRVSQRVGVVIGVGCGLC